MTGSCSHFTTLLWALVASWVAGIAARLLLSWFQVVDNPNQRSSHDFPTVRGGGISFLIVFYLAVFFLTKPLFPPPLGPILIAALGLALVSFVDDFKSVPASVRFACHTISALIALWSMHQGWVLLDRIGGLQVVGLGLLGLLWITGYTNAFNFMDGINGLAASQAVLSASGMAVLAGTATGHWGDLPITLCFLLAAVMLGFLPHNFPTARMFMGDVGSAPLGFLLATLLLWLVRDLGWWLAIPLVLIHANFILDTTITLLRRIAQGERWYKPHREHFYQRLVRSGRSHTSVTLIQALLQVVVLSLILQWPNSEAIGRCVIAITILSIWILYFAYAEFSFRRQQRATTAPQPQTKA